MKYGMAVLALLVGCAPAAGGGRIEPGLAEPPPMPAALRHTPLTTLDLIHMTEAGLDEDAILDRIAAEGVAARPTPTAVEELRAHGVSERVIAAYDAAPLVPRPLDPPVRDPDATQPWWFVNPSWHEDYGRTLQVR